MVYICIYRFFRIYIQPRGGILRRRERGGWNRSFEEGKKGIAHDLVLSSRVTQQRPLSFLLACWGIFRVDIAFSLSGDLMMMKNKKRDAIVFYRENVEKKLMKSASKLKKLVFVINEYLNSP